MKHIVSALPLLLTASAIALFVAACAFGLRIISPDTLGLGAGFLTCLGLSAMSATESNRRSC